jgi:hypothetical protein
MPHCSKKTRKQLEESMIFHRALGRTLAATAISSALFCVAAFGQVSETAQIDEFKHEMTLPISNIGFSGTLNVPANVLQSIQGGALEIRQSVEYLKDTNRMRVRHFLVAPQAPNPTPENAEVTPIEEYLVLVSDVQRYSNPMALVIMGRVDRLLRDSPFGRLQGGAFIYSFGYEPGEESTDPTELTNVALLMPGRLATYIQESSGTLTFGTSGPGTTDPTGPTANAGADIVTTQSLLTLDGSSSSHSEDLALTYSWRVTQGSANILEPTSAQPRVQLNQNFGDYVFELTVTDPAGKTSTDTVKVSYSGRF